MFDLFSPFGVAEIVVLSILLYVLDVFVAIHNWKDTKPIGAISQ